MHIKSIFDIIRNLVANFFVTGINVIDCKIEPEELRLSTTRYRYWRGKYDAISYRLSISNWYNGRYIGSITNMGIMKYITVIHSQIPD